MRILKIITIVLIFLLKSNLYYGQSLDSLINEAIKNNPKLLSLKLKTKAAEYKAESVNSYPAPTIGFEFSGIPFGKFNLFNDAFGNQLSVSQMFMLGGKVDAMTEVEKKNSVIETDNFDIYKVSLIGQIKMSYYNMWLIERKIEIQIKNIDLYSRLVDNLQSVYSVNKSNQTDILMLNGEIVTGQTQLLILEKQLEAEKYKLNNLLGRELNSNSIKTERQISVDSLKFSLNELEEILKSINPMLKQMDNMVEMNKAMLSANEKESVPDLMLQFMVMRQPQGMILTTKSDLSMIMPGDAKSEYMYSIMASINLPFVPWSINKYKAKHEELAAGIKSIEYEKVDMQREMITKLKEALVKYKTAEDLLKLYSQKVIPLYEQSAEIQIAAYLNNKTGINSIIDTYRMLLMQQMNYLMAQADSQMALSEIEMMVGSSQSLTFGK